MKRASRMPCNYEYKSFTNTYIVKTKVQRNAPQENSKYFSIEISSHCAILQQSKKHKRSSAFEKMISLDTAVAKKILRAT